MTALRLEVCVDSADLLDVCATPMVDRIELCSALNTGGLTPSFGLMQCANAVWAKTHAMIRPRAGDFIYSTRDIDGMHADIDAVRRAGLAGVVIGAATPDRTLDMAILRDLIDAAGGLCVTLHRVIDTVVDPLVAVDQAIDLGIARILSSGAAPSATAGADMLAAMEQRANGGITIMAGAGVTARNLAALRTKTGLSDFHSSCSYGGMVADDPFGLGAVSDPDLVRGNIMELHAILMGPAGF
jgi:copper homeostasis protein